MIAQQPSTHLKSRTASRSRRGAGSVGGKRTAKGWSGKGRGTSLDAEILRVLQRGPLSTTDLASKLSEFSAATIYHHCSVLEENGWLKSELERGVPLVFCVKCGRVTNNYPDCKRKNHMLRAFFSKKRVWRISKKRVRRIEFERIFAGN
ncbi:MAG TPA: winged helix-turn-helix domain-containing protein [Blastocatellia bacterium]|nr:winged helix-turn-helix domain-containing protein [Blastocatellia bacterium]